MLLCLLLLRCALAAATRRVKVHHISPYAGRHEGGLLVNVTGKGFVVATDPKCRFDTDQVVATVRSTTRIQCITPPNLVDHFAKREKTLEVFAPNLI